MNLQETIRRILREETEIPKFIRRRLNLDFEKTFRKSLIRTVKLYKENKGKWNQLTFDSFRRNVVNNIMQNISSDSITLKDGRGRLHDFLEEYYNDRILDKFNELESSD
jgi:hypothetical protein